MKVCEVCGARFRGNPPRCPLDGGALVKLPDPLVGRTIGGRYLVSEKIGAGGMGIVYRAKHEVVGRDVAIKFLAPELAYEPLNKTRFLREARAANRINHEHIIDITDYGETDDGLVYLVMEYLVGMALNEAIGGGPLPLDRAMNITLQCARALARAHELDVVHRDIKPDNIYLLEGYDEDFVKILDFGLAHMKGELRVTATGTVFGTPEYMSPEQARGAPITPAADLYSLGCVLFEMLTSSLPFTGATPDLILKHLREPARAPSFFVPSIPPEIDEVVLKLLEKDPRDRYASAFELAELCKEWIELHRGTVPPTPVVEVREGEGESRDTSPSIAALVDRWEDRVVVFRKLVERAHPNGDAPAWLPDALEALSVHVQSLAALRDQLLKRVTVAITQEEEVRQSRMRIGHAIDALALDEARISREMSAADGRLAEAQERLGQVVGPLRAAWAKVPPYQDQATLDVVVVKALAEAGALAKIQLDAATAIGEVEKTRRDLVRQREDLAFQIEQLKGRMGGLSAATDVDLDDLRRETNSLNRDIQTTLDEVVAKAGPIVRHFMEFPHLRDVVRGTHGTAVADG